MENKQAFIVDIGKTMIDTNRITSDGKDKQRLFCKCGNSHTFNAKVKRNIVKNHDTTVEDKESLQAVQCPKCKASYSYENKVCLLIPDKEEIFSISFTTKESKNHNGEKITTLYKTKHFAQYITKSDKLNIISRTDFVKLNKETKTISIFLNQPFSDEDSSISTSSDGKNQDNISETITLSRLSRLENLFKFYEFVRYEGLEQAFGFLSGIDNMIMDLDAIKKIPAVEHLYKNHKISYEGKDGAEMRAYQMLDSGYGDGKKIRKSLSVGSYLSRLLEMSKIFFSVISYPSITTVLLTKGKEFFFDLLNSTNVCNPNVYSMHQATFPYKIVEISTNYDRNGGLKKVTDNNNNRGLKSKRAEDEKTYLKVSPVIYKHIKTSSDMDVLLNVYSKGYVEKLDIETMFQSFDVDRLYKLYRQLDKQSRMDVELTVKHIKHIMKENLDDSKVTGSHDFLSLYIDTLRTAGLLELHQSYIFKIRTAKDLKEIHDDLATRYNAVKDAKKSEFYVKAAKEFVDLNCVIGDIGFTVIPTLEGLNKEGMTMGHCVYTYLSRICDKQYLTVHVQHLISNERATLGMNRGNKNLEFDQLKGYKNSRASREMIEAVTKFCQNNKISTNRGSSSDLSPNDASRVRMHDYLSDKDVEKIREERRKKEEAEKKKKEKNNTAEKSTAKDKLTKKGLFGLF